MNREDEAPGPRVGMGRRHTGAVSFSGVGQGREGAGLVGFECVSRPFVGAGERKD